MEAVHRMVAAAVGEMSMAMVRGGAKRSQIGRWIVALRAAADLLEALAHRRGPG